MQNKEQFIYKISTLASILKCVEDKVKCIKDIKENL